MKKTLLISAVLALSLAACGTPTPGTDGGTGGGSTTGGGGGTTGGGGGTTGGGGGTTLDLSTAAKINAYLEGKTMTMTGADIPSHPNGYNEDINFGSASQCYAKVAISQLSGQFNVSSDLELGNVRRLVGGFIPASALRNPHAMTILPKFWPRGDALAAVPGLSREMVERLEAARPSSLAAAGRVPGITPAALAALLVHARRRLAAA